MRALHDYTALDAAILASIAGPATSNSTPSTRVTWPRRPTT
jgi:hypothetical protein